MESHLDSTVQVAMPAPTHTYTQLPKRLQQELSLGQLKAGNAKKGRKQPPNRKDLRKEARTQKKSKQLQYKNDLDAIRTERLSAKDLARSLGHVPADNAQSAAPIAEEKPKTAPKTTTSRHLSERTPSPSPKVSKSIQRKLEEDDAAILRLESKLGRRGKPTKSNNEDGLDSLLEGLHDTGTATDSLLGKRNRAEDEEWLSKKRSRILPRDVPQSGLSDEDELSEEPSGSFSSLFSSDEGEQSVGGNPEIWSDDESSLTESPPPVSKSLRENPYVAPTSTSQRPPASGKYLPPSLRNKDHPTVQDESIIRKRLRGPLNRLSEANLHAIVHEIESVYQNQARQPVSSCLVQILLEILSDSATLSDTFLILHAGVISALYKTIGTDFGAQLVESILGQFKRFRAESIDAAGSNLTDKRLLNLVQTLTEMYNFHVVASTLLYDVIRLLLKTFSETDVELLLRIIRNCGPSLRQDDPSSLKAIALEIKARAAKAGTDHMTVRTKFMIETVEEIQKKGSKSQAAFSPLAAEHRIAMRKLLGQYNKQIVKASEPLRFGLADLEQADKRGKWWLVGSSFKSDEAGASIASVTAPKADSLDPPTTDANREAEDSDAFLDDSQHFGTDLAHLARQQRMNTDVRRSIFVAIMSASDYNDAYLRLKKLHLKKKQELDIPKVLIHCARTERSYNPFYTLLARRFCAEHKLRVAFRFGLWDIFRQTGEKSGFEDDEDGEGFDQIDDDDRSDQGDDGGNGSSLNSRALVNLGKMFGTLIADGGLSLDVCKNLNWMFLKRKTSTLVEIILVTLILQQTGHRKQYEKEKSTSDSNSRLVGSFTIAKEMPAMAGGVRWFLRKVVRRSDLMANEEERRVLKNGCQVIDEALKRMAMTVTE